MNMYSEGKISGRIICTPSPAAKNAFFYAIEMGIVKKEEVRGEYHHAPDSWLFVSVSDGKGELSYGDEEYKLGKGDCFLIDCRIPHSYKSSEDFPCEFMWVHFGGATSMQYYENFIAQSGNVFHPVAFEKVTMAMREMLRYHAEKDVNAEVITSGLIVQLLTIALTSTGKAEMIDSALRHKLQAINIYIEENFTEDISLEKLSSEFYISKFYLSREYKKIYGKTIFQHIITCRINYGKQLLRFSDKSVEEIAHQCGFNDQSYFVRQFKKSENVTCFAYRKMWRE
ncbi:MAG: AraC family transcriptional regulator [Ruminococcus sp.]|nr:AraC family transcriptional regulator [Ruminococcus sp.]